MVACAAWCAAGATARPQFSFRASALQRHTLLSALCGCFGLQVIQNAQALDKAKSTPQEGCLFMCVGRWLATATMFPACALDVPQA